MDGRIPNFTKARCGRVRTVPLSVFLLATLGAAAGCAGKATRSADTLRQSLDSVQVDATATTESIRGVVVDEAIRPIPRAHIRKESRNVTAESNQEYQMLVTLFHQAEAPEGWSVVKGDA
jgi:hypothetical protein